MATSGRWERRPVTEMLLLRRRSHNSQKGHADIGIRPPSVFGRVPDRDMPTQANLPSRYYPASSHQCPCHPLICWWPLVFPDPSEFPLIYIQLRTALSQGICRLFSMRAHPVEGHHVGEHRARGGGCHCRTHSILVVLSIQLEAL